MSRKRIGRAALAAVLAVAAGVGGAIAAGPGANAAQTDPLAGKKYVALGDSFASGLGLAPYATTPAPACFQSASGIAAQVAAAHRLQLTDVSCAGATIADVAARPQSLPGGGTVPAQLDAVTPDTALVSLMIGGNDVGFSTVLPTCAAGSANGPLLLDPTTLSCAAKYGAQLGAGLQASVAPALDALLAAIHQKAPDATIVLLGYPSLSPSEATTPASGCFSSALGTGQPPFPQNAFPFTTVDRSFIAGLSAQLDAVQQAAATKNGAVFVSTLAATDTHAPCAGTADPWLNGITLQSLTPPGAQPASMHPNATGAAFLADRLAEAFAAAVPATPEDPGTPGDSGGSTDSGGPGAGGDGGSGGSAATASTGSTSELAATGAHSPELVFAALFALVAGGVLLLRRRVRAN